MLWAAVSATAQTQAQTQAQAPDQNTGQPARTLYLQLGQVALDPSRVYQVRGASLDRSSVHISLDDGTIAFTKDVMGRITGAFFEGDGEVLLTPPNAVERKSMSLFTGMAILEEHFATAYFRFNDDAAEEMRPDLRATENKQEFIDRWSATAQNLAQADAMRLMVSFSRMLPVTGGAVSSSEKGDLKAGGEAKDRFLHARLQGVTHGVFDLYFDSLATEQVQAGQAKAAENGIMYYDVWTSFTPSAVGASGAPSGLANAGVARLERGAQGDWVAIRRFTITTEVDPPKQIQAQARLQLEAKASGQRMMLFELSRFLTVQGVKLDGRPVEFIHNPAVEGTQLSRRGNDFVAVILPQQAQAGQKMDLDFTYSGEVLASAGSGLLYVGARGTWYPNRGLVMADFDLQFNYPPGWTLVATGKPTPGASTADASARAKGLETSRWVSERPIPVAGFNLGKYKVARTQAGDVTVETYATQSVETGFPSAPLQTIEPNPGNTAGVPQVIVPNRPSPAMNEVLVGEAAARAIRYYAARFGPYPYSHLELTQMPGRDSQGWPGLVFLSSYAFLDDEQRRELHFEPYRILLQQSIPAHETAHQWWGDLVNWESYRDQWLSEGLANYCALMMLQEKDPDGFRQVMEKYRRDLVEENKDGMALKDAGPVTLGFRLLSSRSPEGYEAISYGRSTWLFHMLRTMLKDAAAEQGQKSAGSADEPFVRALHNIRNKYEGKAISTRELLDGFAEELPPALRYEGKNSLDWFLEGWVNGTTLPTLELTGVRLTPKEAGFTVSGTILQKDAAYDLVTSVPIYAVVSGKQPVLLGRVFADGAESSFHVAAPAGTRKIEIDPYQTILTSPKK
jgi:peptidase M1-like protein